MDPPSSPPLLPHVDNGSSPIISAEDDGDFLPIRPSLVASGNGARKRPFSENENLSSEAWFSEDEDNDGIDQRPRRKRLVQGPWWRVHGLRKIMAKQERRRNADSGVWLGSDMSEDSVGSIPYYEDALPSERAGQPSSSARNIPPLLSAAEAMASRAIHQCLEAGRERIDLSDLGLTHISASTLRPLHQLIRHAHTDLTQPPSEDEFGPLTPSIQLFLSGNKLQSLPHELFTLANISVLSLRNNELTGIPPSISSLTDLKELNIAQNSITYLPWEMFDVMHCRGNHRQITTRPNPLIDPVRDLGGPRPLPRPRVTPGEFKEHLSRWGETNGAFFQKMREWYSEEGEQWTMRHELELRLKLGRLKRTNYLQEASRAGAEIQLCNEQLIYLSSSAVRYFDVDSSPLRLGGVGKASNDEHEVYRAVVDPLIHAQPLHERRSVPSLFEIALRHTQATFNLQDSDELPDDLPESITDALRLAAKGAEVGNEVCSECGTKFIIARAEWMEYWFNGFPSQECLTRETILPFMRRACSWACARPSEMGSFRF